MVSNLRLDHFKGCRFLVDGDIWIPNIIGIICYFRIGIFRSVTSLHACIRLEPRIPECQYQPLWSCNSQGILFTVGDACYGCYFGSPLMPDLMGIIAGHLYYFLTVLHPLAGGRNMQNLLWVQKLVTRYRIGAPAVNTRVQPNPTTGGAFSGRSYRVGQ